MEAIRPSSDLRNKYPEISSLTRESQEPVFITVNGREDTVLMRYTQYGKMKAELELLKMLAEAQDDVDNERTAPIEDTFSDIRKNLLTGKSYDLLLREQPYYGVESRNYSLKKMKFRIVPVENHLVFNKVRERDQTVIIYAIVDSRRDYANIIF